MFSCPGCVAQRGKILRPYAGIIQIRCMESTFPLGIISACVSACSSILQNKGTPWASVGKDKGNYGQIVCRTVLIQNSRGKKWVDVNRGLIDYWHRDTGINNAVMVAKIKSNCLWSVYFGSTYCEFIANLSKGGLYISFVSIPARISFPRSSQVQPCSLV